MKWKEHFDELIVEVKSDYLTSVKKAIIDYVLEDKLKKNTTKMEATAERIEVKGMSFRWRHRFEENRRLINSNLFAINNCLAQVLEIWHTTYNDASLVRVDELADKADAYELGDFTVRIHS